MDSPSNPIHLIYELLAEITLLFLCYVDWLEGAIVPSTAFGPFHSFSPEKTTASSTWVDISESHRSRMEPWSQPVFALYPLGFLPNLFWLLQSMVGSVDSYFLNWDLQLLCNAFNVIGYILSKRPFRIHAPKSLLPKLVASSAWFVWRLLAFTLILASRPCCGLLIQASLCDRLCPLGLGNLIGIWFWLQFLEERGVHVMMCLQGFFLVANNR